MLEMDLENPDDLGRVANDRRSSIRFPIQGEMRFRGMSVPDSPLYPGETINVSSRGVLFRTPQLVRRGEWLEAYLTWPAQLNQHIPLQLVVRGPVVRLDRDKVALMIQQHEFRTQAVPRGGGDSPNPAH